MPHIPKVSVVMPAYNAEQYIREAIESILHQTFSNFEFIIIDDGSTDGTPHIIQEYPQRDDRIILLENKKNIWVSITANRGMDIAKGEYIARMDADDISMLDRFEKQVAFLDNNTDIGILGSAINIVNVSGKPTRKKKYHLQDSIIKRNMYYQIPICQGTLMMRTSLIRKYWWYNSDFLLSEDDELYFRLSQYTQFANLSDILLHVRINPTSITKKNILQLETYTRKAKKMLVENYWYKATMFNKLLAFLKVKMYVLTRLLKIYK